MYQSLEGDAPKAVGTRCQNCRTFVRKLIFTTVLLRRPGMRSQANNNFSLRTDIRVYRAIQFQTSEFYRLELDCLTDQNSINFTTVSRLRTVVRCQRNSNVSLLIYRLGAYEPMEPYLSKRVVYVVSIDAAASNLQRWWTLRSSRHRERRCRPVMRTHFIQTIN